MLKLVGENQTEQILLFCQNKALGVRVSSYWLCYGLKFEFLNFWLQEIENEITAVIAKFEQSITICMNEKADSSQVREFIEVIGYQNLQTESRVAQKLGFNDFEQKQMLSFNQDKISIIPAKNSNHENLKPVYNLISKSIPNSFENDKEAYNFWLSDFSYKKRRNLARVFTISENENCIASALTASESENEALMSGVACDENYRGKGLGKITVLSLVDELLKQNKKVFIIALNDGVENFYQKLGFENYKKIAYIKNNNIES